MYLLLGPALRLVLGPAYLGALHVAVLHQRSSTNGGGLVESNLLVLDEAVLPEVLLAVLLLLGLIVGDIGGMAPPVVGVVALHHIVVLCLLDHLHLVDTPLPIGARSGSSNSREAHIDIRTLSVVSSTISTLSIHLFPSEPGPAAATAGKLTSTSEPCRLSLLPRADTGVAAWWSWWCSSSPADFWLKGKVLVRERWSRA